MAKCNTPANDMATTTNNWQTLGTSDPGRYNTPPLTRDLVEDIDLRVTRQEGPGYSYGHRQKPGAKLEDDGPEMGLRPGYGLRPVVTIIIMVEFVV